MYVAFDSLISFSCPIPKTLLEESQQSPKHFQSFSIFPSLRFMQNNKVKIWDFTNAIYMTVLF